MFTSPLVMFALLLALQYSYVAIAFSSSSSSSSVHGLARGTGLQSTPTSIISHDDTTTDNKVDEIASDLIKTCREYGQIGSKLSEDKQAVIDNLAASLEPYTDPSPAKASLSGRHDLIYSSNKGASSGALGPFVGKVSQSFLDDVRFINRVELFGGIVKIELNAERKVLDDTRLRVMFKETAFYIFGNEVKRGEVKGAGVWDYIYSGTVNVDGEKMLLRVLKTPSTFVIAQKE